MDLNLLIIVWIMSIIFSNQYPYFIGISIVIFHHNSRELILKKNNFQTSPSGCRSIYYREGKKFHHSLENAKKF